MEDCQQKPENAKVNSFSLFLSSKHYFYIGIIKKLFHHGSFNVLLYLIIWLIEKQKQLEIFNVIKQLKILMLNKKKKDRYSIALSCNVISVHMLVFI